MISDEELVQSMAAGNQAAFEAFVHRYHGMILGYIERMVRDPGKAEDLTQETFIRLIRQLKQDNVPDQIRPWMYRVAANLCKDYWRSTSYKKEKQAALEPEDQTDTSPSVFEIYERQETRKELLRTLDEIPEVQKDIIVLRFYQDLKLQEIADTLELTLSGVKTHLYNGLKKLKKRLETKRSGAEKEGMANARNR